MTELIKSDLTVIGGGISGITAALSAARHGLKVTLVNDRDVLGGNASSECRVHINGAASSNSSYYAREGGISDEIKMSVFHYNPRYNTKDDYELSDMALLQLVLNEPNISLYSGTAAYDVKVEDNKITAVYAVKPETEQHFEFCSPLFADASGDGIVGFKAGAEFRIGRESKSEYNEGLAVETADSCVMGSCILFTVGKADKPIPFIKPGFAYDYKKDDILKWVNRPETGRNLPEVLDGVDGIWWLSFGGLLDTIKDSDNIDLELKKLVYGFWDYVKNSGEYLNTEKYYLKWVAPFPAKRESRRFIGDYTLTQNDIEACTPFYDSVSTGGWSLDIHDVAGVYGFGKTSSFGFVPSIYNIPYRIMYSKNIENLFLAGRIISATHVAFGSLRVMQTLSAMAQAVGTAAYLCKKHNCLPSDISKSYITDLQVILKHDGQYIQTQAEDCGLSKDAIITASSTHKYENEQVDIPVLLDKDYCITIPLINNTLESVEVKIKNTTDNNQQLDFCIYDDKKQNCYLINNKLCNKSVSICAGFDGWVKLPINCTFENKHKSFIILCKNNALLTFATTQRITGTPSFIFNNNQLHRFKNGDNGYSIGFKNVEPVQALYSPQNVINGYSRPFGTPNLWVSESENNAWLQLDFENAVDINEVQIIFNSQLETDHFNSPIQQLVKDYRLRIFNDNEYVKTVKNNYLTLNKHFISLKNVKKIRIEFDSTYGGKFFEVFSVKVF